MNTTLQAIEDAQYYGVQAFGNEIDDDRGTPDQKSLADLALSMVEISLNGAIADTALEWDRDQFLWSLVNSFHHLAARYDREQDSNMRKIRDLVDNQDGSEIQSYELEQSQTIGERIHGKLTSAEALRDGAAAAYTGITGSPWMPRHGSRGVGPVTTGSAINALDYLNAKEKERAKRFLPEGTPIAFSGHADCQDHNLIWKVLDQTRSKHPDMILLTTGGRKGADLIAGKWAAARGVHLVFFTPNFVKHGKAAAPHKRNDALLGQRPVGLIAFPSNKGNNGIIDNLIGKAHRGGIKVWNPSA